MAGPPPRRAWSCCGPTSPSCTTPSRRPARSGVKRSCSTPPKARAYLEAVRERVVDALAQVGAGDGVLTELVVRHELQHSETMRQTLALAGLLPHGRAVADAAQPARRDWLELPAESLFDGRPSRPRRRGLRLRQRAPPPPRAHRRLRHRTAPRHQRQLAALQRGRRLRAARVVVGRGLGVEGGVRHHPPSLRGSRSTRRRPSATSAGSRPTPSPARTMRGSPRRRSGSGRRPRSSQSWRG